MSWEKIQIKNNFNEIVDAIAPIVISASRSTDIPAFYSKWFFNRLKEGYVTWINPFNRSIQYISFEKVRFIVFWTKNPAPIIPYLHILDELGINYYFQFTLNDYENEQLEPNLPSLDSRIQTFISLSKIIGKDKVIWRFDPLLLSENITIDTLICKLQCIGKMLFNYTDKLVFSFVDITCYKKVQKNLESTSISYKEFSKSEMLLFCKKLSNLNKGWGLSLATCAENIGLETFTIEHNSCIDEKLIYNIGKSDTVLLNWLGRTAHTNLSLFDEDIFIQNKRLKDKGQRKECGCIKSKDIGIYNTCNHMCTYCYANHSINIVKKNIRLHKDNSSSIITDNY